MMSKAQALGLVFDAAFSKEMKELPAKYALDGYTDSYMRAPVGPPLPRAIAADAFLANSVKLRVQYALTYVPPNLKITEGALVDSYQIVNVVDESVLQSL